MSWILNPVDEGGRSFDVFLTGALRRRSAEEGENREREEWEMM